MCSVVAYGSSAASDPGMTAIWFNKSFAGISGVCSVAGSVGVEQACAGISGVCSVEGRVGVEHACAGNSGVCSVAGRVGRERFLKVLLWFCGLFLIKAIARNVAIQHLHKPKELESTNHANFR